MSKKQYTNVGLADILGWEPATVIQVPEANTSKRALWWKITKFLTGLSILAALAIMPLGVAIGAGTFTTANYWESLPSTLPDEALPQPSTILASDGSKIAEFYSENREIVTFDQIPEQVRDAVVSIEDARFYDHGAIDVKGTLRALVSNTQSDSTQGGSTLTQQYAKNILLMGAKTDDERAALTSQTSYVRKIRELKYAAEIEKTQTKDQILEGYLNAAYFGDGAYGIGAASKHYFSKELSELTVGESALLAGVVQNPTSLNPVDNPEGAMSRRNLVLSAMVRTRHLSHAAADQAKQETLKLDLSSPKNGCTSSDYPFFCQHVRETLANDKAFGSTREERQARLYKGGMVIKTTLSPKKQKAAQRAVDHALGRDNRVAAAVAVITPGTGQVTALAQNRTFGQNKKKNQTEIILPTQEAFQPGSSFKPITLAAAIDGGYNLNTVESIPDRYFPPNMNAPKGGFTNSTVGAAGQLTAAQGLWRSSNNFYVKLEAETGIFNVRDMAEKLGYSKVKGLGKRDASFTLGTEETSPLKMANVYATLAAHGKRCDPVVISSIATNGKPTRIPSANCRQVIRPGVADTVATIMKGTISGPDSLRTGKNQDIGRPAAGKTGTTENNASVWFVGFTPQNSTAVWVGDPRGPKYPLQNFFANGQYIGRGYGGVVAGPIWKSVMLDIHKGVKKMAFPAADPSVTTGYITQTPDVRGLSEAAAIAALRDAGLSVKVDTTPVPSPTIPSGAVTRTVPAAGARVPADRLITIMIAKTAHSGEASKTAIKKR